MEMETFVTEVKRKLNNYYEGYNTSSSDFFDKISKTICEIIAHPWAEEKPWLVMKDNVWEAVENLEESDIISERKTKTHGYFERTAGLSQYLKTEIRLFLDTREYNPPVSIREALDAICLRLARIACGDCNYADHYIDIAGYADLIIKILVKERTVGK